MKQFVYNFSEGNKHMRDLLGGKGANLAEMIQIGLPVPAGFTLTTEACNQYFEDGNKINKEIQYQLHNAIQALESETGKKFGGNPCLLVSVRSGSVFSMPGMMDTILNLGLNDVNVLTLAESTGSLRFALDCYRRFIQMFSNVVSGVPMYHFENAMEDIKEKNGIEDDRDLTEEHLSVLIDSFKAIVLEHTGEQFTQDAKSQLYTAIEAVFRSWNNERAKIYRQHNNIPDSIGTAVNVQMMVFGNMGDTSGTGVVFTRDPSTGNAELYGEFLMNAQGEDVVTGIRTPQSVSQLQEVNEKIYQELSASADLLEKHYSDMQDIEFTIENGNFYILQTRNGKRSAAAAVRIAVDFVNEGKMTKEQALKSLDLKQIDQLMHPEFDKAKLKEVKELAVGLPANPGAASGKIYFDNVALEAAKEAGEDTILVRVETSPEDIKGMVSSNGVLTARGGMTSHAAVVARGMGKCCVSGCGALNIDEKSRKMTIGGVTLTEGDFISIDGRTGKVYAGKVETTSASLDGTFETVMTWADEFSTMEVLANADTPADAKRAKAFGAKGIGLCRTEHMFFDGDRIIAVREMIMAKTDDVRNGALEKLFPYQKGDFKALFEIMEGMPVNIRLLDPPLHEFLPTGDGEVAEMANILGLTTEEIKNVIEELEEVNPMMGLRGCRLGIIYPAVYKMQARAIVTAALELVEETGNVPCPEIMIPLVGFKTELQRLKKMIRREIESIDTNGLLGHIKIGTMIEVPRACMTADRIAEEAEYFSFGTNDLTQMTLGFSRDDAGTFIREYKKLGLLEADPFQSIDVSGVGQLMKIAIAKGKEQRPDIKLGVCGEQAGEEKSVAFLNTLGLHYISCSPYRIPKARLAAGQAAIVQKLELVKKEADVHA